MSVTETEVMGTATRREDRLQAVEALFADVEVWAREWLTPYDMEHILCMGRFETGEGNH